MELKGCGGRSSLLLHHQVEEEGLADRRNELTLKGSPIKKGFKIAHAKALPTSMHINVPYEEGDQTYFQRQVDPSKFTGGKDFVRYIRDGDPSKANASMTALKFVKKLHTARKKSIMSRLQTPQK